MKKQNTKAFTLVELIVVITILAILWTIWFLSLQWYSKSSRDSKRISDITNIKKSLDLFSINTGKYPEPDNGEEVTYDWAEVWTQWIIWDQVTTNLSKNLQKKPLDPLTNIEYTYSLLNTNKEYELLASFESNIVSSIWLNETFAEWEKEVIAYITWNYNWVMTKVSTWTMVYVLALPSIIWTDIWDLESLVTNKNLIYDWLKFKINWETDLTLTNKLVAFSWTLEDLWYSDTQVQLIKDLQIAYDSTNIVSEWEIQYILNTDTTWDFDWTKIKAITLIHNNIDPNLELKNYSNWVTNTDWDFNNWTNSSTSVGNGTVKLASAGVGWTTPIILDWEWDDVILESQTEADDQIWHRGISIWIDSQDNVHVSYNERYSQRYITNKDWSWTMTWINDHTFDSATSLLIDSQDKLHLSWYWYWYTWARLNYINNVSGSFSTEYKIDDMFYNMAYLDTVFDSNYKIHSAYINHDQTLSYATNKSGSWVTEVIDDRVNTAQSRKKPKDVSIAIDSNDYVHISYLDAFEILTYITNKSGSWVREEIYNTSPWLYSSIVIDSNDFVHISYYDSISDDLKYITNKSWSWVDTTIDSTWDVWFLSSIVIDSQDALHISYLDKTTDMIKYATNKSGSWVISDVASQWWWWEWTNIAITLDSSENPHISYYYCDTWYNTSLKYVKSAPIYESNGNYTSTIYDTGENIKFNNIEWIENLPTGTNIQIKVRTSNDSNMTWASDWNTCNIVSNGQDISTNNCVNNGDKYIQYQVSMSTSDISSTPLLDKVTISYN